MPPVRRSQIEVHEVHHDKGLDVRLSLALVLSTIQVTVRFCSVKFPKILKALCPGSHKIDPNSARIIGCTHICIEIDVILSFTNR
ncbi:hypothetical protein TNCV_4171721 [Trichonephila clavipes]|nr:hypothetical protein TNCV_4171721 [Trichonephila clavipes]